jgi:hypothetical protein
MIKKTNVDEKWSIYIGIRVCMLMCIYNNDVVMVKNGSGSPRDWDNQVGLVSHKKYATRREGHVEAAAFFPISGKNATGFKRNSIRVKKTRVCHWICTVWHTEVIYTHWDVCIGVQSTCVSEIMRSCTLRIRTNHTCVWLYKPHFLYYAKQRYTSMCVIGKLYKISRHIQMK